MATEGDGCALAGGVGDLEFHLFDGGLVDERTNGHAVVQPVARLELGHPGRQLSHELVSQRGMYEQAIGTDARLPGVEEFHQRTRPGRRGRGRRQAAR